MACRKWNAQPFKLLAFPPLPKERTWATRAFQNVGLDYMGPITVRDFIGPSKRWIALFTCLATRAIRLEAAKNLPEEEKEAQPTPKSKEFVRHLADKNLQEEETEEEEESRTERKTTRRTYAHTLSTVLVVLIATFVMASSAPAKSQFHVCAKYGHGLYVKMPDKLNCKEVREEMHNSSQIVEVLSRAFISANATFCAKVTRTVCTKCFLRWSLAVTRDETTVHNMTPSQCMEMRRSLELSGIRLEPIDANRWASKQPTEYSYGWIGTRCHTTTNYRMEQGVIKFYDGLSRTSGCNKTLGKCITATETILWDPSELANRCPYRTLGKVNAQISNRFVTIPSMQAVFVRGKETQNDMSLDTVCKFRKAEVMKNGVVIEFSPEEQPSREGSNRALSARILFVEQLPEEINKKSDASVNAKLQFLWNSLSEREQRITQEIRHRICEQHNRILWLIGALSRTDPTTAARVLLKRMDIAAENIGDLLKVFPCKKLEVSEVFTNHKVQDRCYRDLPVRYKDKILFVHPRSREIKAASEEVDCREIRMKQDREITEEWALGTEDEESVFDAPPLTDISEERLQWVLGMIDKNPQVWERSAEKKEKSTADSIRDEAEEIIEAASDAFQKSSVVLARELEDIAFRWRWIMGAAIAVVLAVGPEFDVLEQTT
uniref:Glycoprotein n=1 Tax=Ascaris lumbricoides TaxID=6252 RepID=A0A0M3IN65_ASCLU